VDRDIQRRETLIFDPLPVRWAEVGEGEVGAVKKTQPIVVILEIETAPMAGGLLIDEAEGAVVVALLQAIEERLPEHEPQAVIRLLLQLHPVKAPLGILHLQGELLLPAENLEVDEIARTDAVDAEEPVAALKAQLLSD
jgi:hypothetical protein